MNEILNQLNGPLGAIIGGAFITGLRAWAISQAKQLALQFMLGVAKQAEDLAFETGAHAMKFVIENSYAKLPKWIRIMVSRTSLEIFANAIYNDTKIKTNVEIKRRINEKRQL